MKSKKLMNSDICNSPGEWNFYQAARKLECANKSAPRIGTSHCPSEDLVRFGQKVTLAFSPNDIASYQHNENNAPSKMEVNCLGTLGSNGPLSLQLTQHIYQRAKHSKDYTFIAFLNMFHNRMVSFLYRAWAMYQPAVSCDREDEDYFLKIFKSLVGYDYPPTQKSQNIEDHVHAFYSGLMTKTSHGRGGLVAVLYDYFNVPVKLEQFTGLWDKIKKEYHCRLGLSPFNSSLDGGMALGERHWDCKKKFKIKLGPMSYKKYTSFLPGKPAFNHLVEWVKKFNISHYEWELQLVLKANEAPLCGIGTQLGYTTWMTSEKNTHDREDLIIVKPTLK